MPSNKINDSKPETSLPPSRVDEYPVGKKSTKHKGLVPLLSIFLAGTVCYSAYTLGRYHEVKQQTIANISELQVDHQEGDIDVLTGQLKKIGELNAKVHSQDLIKNILSEDVSLSELKKKYNFELKPIEYEQAFDSCEKLVTQYINVVGSSGSNIQNELAQDKYISCYMDYLSSKPVPSDMLKVLHDKQLLNKQIVDEPSFKLMIKNAEKDGRVTFEEYKNIVIRSLDIQIKNLTDQLPNHNLKQRKALLV